MCRPCDKAKDEHGRGYTNPDEAVGVSSVREEGKSVVRMRVKNILYRNDNEMTKKRQRRQPPSYRIICLPTFIFTLFHNSIKNLKT